MKFFIISGRSGSGKSTLLHALEDEGFNCIDNFPARLLDQLVARSDSDASQDCAVCIDVRNPVSDLEKLPDLLSSVTREDLIPRIIYLDALSPVLVKRFSDTRRRHPLEQAGMDLREAIDTEARVLRHIVEIADLKLDTTQLSTHDLALIAKERLAGVEPRQLSLLFRSFGYRHGVPVDADFVFDIRCLPNPYWVSELRDLTGLDDEVKQFLQADDEVEAMFDHIVKFLSYWLPRFERQNRVYMTVAIGCTGGRHRSVYMSERMADHFRASYPHVLVRHREHAGKMA